MGNTGCGYCGKIISEDDTFWNLNEDKEICRECYERERARELRNSGEGGDV